jgi:hypothetical protein
MMNVNRSVRSVGRFRAAVAVGVAVVVAATSVLVTAPAHAQEPPSPEYKTLQCSAGGFTGSARGLLKVSDSGATFVLSGYTISVSNSAGDSGNNANVNSGVTESHVAPGGGRTEYAYSPDTMTQDGKWHPLYQSVAIGAVYAESVYTAQVAFVFDLKGEKDPSCTAMLGTGLAPWGTRAETISCTIGNFTGRAEVTLMMAASGAKFVVRKYQLVDNNRGPVGRTANVDSGVTEFRADGGGVRTAKAYSADAMKQDGESYSLHQVVTINATDAASIYQGQVSFTFDVPGSTDPGCSAVLEAS